MIYVDRQPKKWSEYTDSLFQVHYFEKKKPAFLAPAVPDVNSKEGRRGQSSIGALCYRFEQIFWLKINFMGFLKSLIFNSVGCFFMVWLLVLNVSNPFGHPGWRLYLPFSAKMKWTLS